MKSIFNKYVSKKKLVVFFYPKDESPVCTKEACAFRDAYANYTDANAVVIGINNGTVASHKAFAEKEHLPFTLLSDPDNQVLTIPGKRAALWDDVKVSGRETFVIGLDGTIAFSFRDFMKGDAHSDQVLAIPERKVRSVSPAKAAYRCPCQLFKYRLSAVVTMLFNVL